MIFVFVNGNTPDVKHAQLFSTGQVTTWLYLGVIGVNLVLVLIFPVYTAEVYPTSTRAQMYGIDISVGRILPIAGPFFFYKVNIMGWL